MPDPTPRSAGWPILVGAILAGLSVSFALSLWWGVSFLNALVFFAIIAVLVGVNWLILTLTDRRRRP
jgi:hypothetical protein